MENLNEAQLKVHSSLLRIRKQKVFVEVQGSTLALVEMVTPLLPFKGFIALALIGKLL